MHELTDKKWEEFLKSDKLTIVEFWAPWCPWCKRLTPILDKMEHDYSDRITFTMLNTEDFPDIASKYGVMSLPNIMFFCSGRIVGGLIGYTSEEKLKQEFDKVLSKYKDCYSQSSKLKKLGLVNL